MSKLETIVRPLLGAGELRRARAAISEFLQKQSRHEADVLAEAAYWFCQANDFFAAKQLYQQVCEQCPNHKTWHYNLATTCRVTGDIAQAESALIHHLNLSPSDAEAHWLLVQLRPQTEQDNRVDVLKNLLTRSLPPKQQVHAWYALGKVMEDLQRHDDSFAAFQSGAALRRRYLKYQVDQDLAIFDQIQKTFDESWWQSHPGGESQAGKGNIFILGMPRSGSTLLETMLADAGSDVPVAMGGELNAFSAAMMAQVSETSAASHIKSAIETAAGIDYMRLGRDYQYAIRDYGYDPNGNQCEVVTDKLPLNFLYTGLIKKALPAARIILIEREPMDCIWSVYKHLFSHAYPFSYDLDELTDYYAGYQALMRHWQNLPGLEMMTIRYEDLVSEPQKTLQQIGSYCGIPLKTEYFQGGAGAKGTSAMVTTGSAAQVREPLHNRFIGQWHRYESHLAQVKRRLQQAETSISG